MLDWADGDRTMAACQALVGVWLDGVVRQQQAHADALSTYCARQVQGVRMLAETRDAAQFAVGLLS
jgi:hypothetical protein